MNERNKKPERQNKHVRKGDTVLIISGNEKGMKGTVLSRTEDRAVIQGLNIRTKAVKKSQANPHGGHVKTESSIHISNVRLCDNEGKPLKLKVRQNQSGERELVSFEGKQETVFRQIKKPK